jgi:hypothetical protein
MTGHTSLAARMGEKCSNCEVENATIQCQNCPKNESIFCRKCWGIHVQLKLFKNHQFSSIKVLCSNCETRSALFQCRQCLEPDSFFCKECSEIHTQVKTFRCHNFIQLDLNSKEPEIEVIHQSSTFSKILDQLYSYFLYLLKYFDFDESQNDFFSWIPESISEIVGTTLDKNTILFGLFIAFVAHILIKLLFGKNSIYIIIAIGILGVRWLKRSQSLLAEEVKKIEKKNHHVIDQMKTLRSKTFFTQNDDINKEEMKSEFWHDKDQEPPQDSPSIAGFDSSSKQIFAPKFKPRGVLYQGRRSQKKESLEDLEQRSDDSKKDK